MPYTPDQARAEIAELVRTFKASEARLNAEAEAQIENNFIRPLFRCLNWNTENSGLAVSDYEFLVQKTHRYGKRPDYILQLDGQHLLVMDAKQVKYDMHDPRWTNQVYAYAYSTQNLPPARKIDFAILTDFQEFVVLDCTLYAGDPKAVGNFRVLDWRCDDFVTQFQTLWELFERENLRQAARSRGDSRIAPTGLWARLLSPKKVKANRTPPDKAFLAEMDDDSKGWRVRLAKDMKKRNPQADGALITAAVQLLIDRLIFVKALSDREIEDDYLAQLAETVERAGLSESDTGWFAACRSIFEKLNQFYNGSIFEPRPELESVTVSNKVVRDILRALQPENSPYNFAVLPVEILGTIYERFLGRVVRTTEKQVKIEDKPEVRKAGGVYYTPQYIVDYIVQNTVGKLLEKCATPDDAARLKILDPACGSGSFLLGAYAALIDWHVRYFSLSQRERGGVRESRRNRDKFYLDADGRVRLTAQLKRRILLNNLFGVDIDPQAVEVTRFSLSLKALEDTRREELTEERSLFQQTVLPDLSANVKCGNSLIGSDYSLLPLERLAVKAFDWEHEFPQVFALTPNPSPAGRGESRPLPEGEGGRRPGEGELHSGFDAVIGNPPYIRMEEFKEIKSYLRTKYQTHADRADIFYYFVERASTLLRQDGRLGFILSNTFARSKAGQSLRAFMTKNLSLERLVEFGDFTPFADASVYPIIVIASKASPSANMVAFVLQDGDPSLTPAEEQFPVLFKLDRSSFGEEAWVFDDPRSTELRARLLSELPPLQGKYGEVSMGIKSGLNEAFLLSDAQRNEILASNPNAGQIIKPYVGGRNLDHYHCGWDNEWLIYAPHGIDMTPYPAVLEHLRPFKSNLQKRATQQAWYELQQPQEEYAKLFDKPKIIFPDISRYPKFSLDRRGMYFSNTVYFVPSDSLYLLGLLNSKLMWFVIRGLSNALRGGMWRFRLFSGHIERLPIRTINVSDPADKARHDRMVQLVESMLELHRHKAAAKTQAEQDQLQRQIDLTDRQIDALVYELYGLTDDEIRVVEGKA